MRRTLLILGAASMAASCSPFGRLQPDGRPVAEVDAAMTLAVTDASPIRRTMEMPVLTPPEVFAVYVPSHLDRERDLLVGEHWVYFKLTESEWFTEKRVETPPKTTGAAAESQMVPLKSLAGLDKAVTPWRQK